MTAREKKYISMLFFLKENIVIDKEDIYDVVTKDSSVDFVQFNAVLENIVRILIDVYNTTTI